MARTTINKTARLGSYPALPLVALSADLSMQAASGSSGSNGNQIPFGSASKLIVIVQNSAGAPGTVTFTSLADPFNRTGDISAYSLAAGGIAEFEFNRAGWVQSDGNLYCEASAVTMKFGAFDG
jgi:hypothetical protein